MSQFSLKNALLIAFLTPSILLSFQSHAQMQEACQNVELSLDGQGQLMLNPESLLVPNVHDDENRYELDKEMFNCADIGAHTVTVSTVYADGSMNTCVSIVKIVDEIAPRLLPKENVTVQLSKEGVANPVMTSLIDIKEACTNLSELDLYFSQTTFTTADLGDQVEMKIIATDASGNEAEKEFQVKVLPYHANTSGGIVRPELNLTGADNTFDFYPNPATNVVTLTSKEMSLGTVTILNSTGKEVMKIDSSGLKTQIEIDELPVGMYFIECNSKVKRFVKK
ncbi:MAG: T9SS type A sorting domain-containing protein [Flavobacteriales bacterium]